MSKTKILIAVCCALLSACAGQQRRDMQEFEESYSVGAYLEAAQSSEKKIKLKEGELYDKDHLLQHLEAGEAYRLAGMDNKSIEHFNAAEAAIKDWETRAMAAKIGEGAGSILVNDTIRDYQPASMEGILSNAYKAITYMSMGDVESARVEFNRADERHRIAVEINKKKIKQAESDIEQKKREDANVSSALADSRTNSAVRQRYAAMDKWQAYPEFVNPGIVYMQSLFLMGEGVDQADREKAVSYMKRVAGMSPNNRYVAEDLQIFDDFASGRRNGERYVWVVHETGQGPLLEEQKFDVPIPYGNQLLVASMALPYVKTRQAQVRSLDVIADGTTHSTESFASMDRVVQSQFKKEFPGVMARSLASAAVKTIAQKEIGDENPYAGLAMMIFSMASASADIRVWRAMPKYYGVTRVPYPSDGHLQIMGRDVGQIYSGILPDADHTLIYVKTPTALAKPYVRVIPFGYDGDFAALNRPQQSAMLASVTEVDTSTPDYGGSLSVGATSGAAISQYTDYVSDDYELVRDQIAVHKKIDWLIDLQPVENSFSSAGLKTVQVRGTSDSKFIRYVEYRPTWFDADGMKIDTILTRWEKIKVLPGEQFAIKMVAPGVRAKNALIEIRKGAR